MGAKLPLQLMKKKEKKIRPQCLTLSLSEIAIKMHLKFVPESSEDTKIIGLWKDSNGVYEDLRVYEVQHAWMVCLRNRLIEFLQVLVVICFSINNLYLSLFSSRSIEATWMARYCSMKQGCSILFEHPTWGHVPNDLSWQNMKKKDNMTYKHWNRKTKY